MSTKHRSDGIWARAIDLFYSRRLLWVGARTALRHQDRVSEAERRKAKESGDNEEYLSENERLNAD